MLVVGLAILVLLPATLAIALGESAPPSTVTVEGGLLDTTRDIDVVSPLGLDQSLCAILPGMSTKAHVQVRVTLGDVCRKTSIPTNTSIWLDTSISLRGDILSAFQVNAEVHREKPPLNKHIADWLSAHDVPVVVPDAAIVFASVNALNYSQSWRLPFLQSTTTRLFHGRNRIAMVHFVAGSSQGWADRQHKCERIVLPTGMAGTDFVVMTLAGSDSNAAIKCLEYPVLSMVGVPADVSIPLLNNTTTRSLRERLARRGLTSIFHADDNPFAPILEHFALSEILQAITFRLDMQGVGVKASTLAFVTLKGRPRGPEHVVFDRPFVIRVIGPENTTVALGVVENLR